MLMTRTRYVALVLLLGTSGCYAEQASRPVAAPEPPTQSSPAQLLEGEIDRSSTPLLTVDDALPAGSLLIDSGTELQHKACAGAAVEIRGDYRIVELDDHCERVRITGNFNVVRVHATDLIEIVGADNAVTWHTVPGDDSGRKKPILVMRGERNLVAPGD